MEKEENEDVSGNLPVVKEKSFLKESTKRNIGKVADLGKKIFKIAGLGVVSMGAMGVGTYLSGPLAVASLAGGIYAGVRSGINALYKVSPDSMFIESKIGNKIGLHQDTRIGLTSKIKGYSPYEKGAMMGLQTLVGLARDKENLIGSETTEEPDGTKLYKPEYSTITHGINLKNFEVLQELGYIKITGRDSKINTSVFANLLHLKPKEKKSLLFTEKIGFKNYDDLKKIWKAFVTGDKDTLEEMKRPMEKVTFRLTDKPVDFEEIYAKCNDLSQEKDPAKRKAYTRLSAVFHARRGILGQKSNLGINKDSFGRTYLSYVEKESFAKKTDRKLGTNYADKILRKPARDEKTVKTMDEQLREGVHVDEKVAIASAKQQEKIAESEKEEQK